MTDAAIEAVDVVLGHCRVLSDALFVEGIRREYRAEDGRYYVGNPHTISWFSGDDPENLGPLGIYPGGVNATASSGAVRAPERGAVEFERLHDSIEKHGGAPPLSLACLLALARSRPLARLTRGTRAWRVGRLVRATLMAQGAGSTMARFSPEEPGCAGIRPAQTTGSLRLTAGSLPPQPAEVNRRPSATSPSSPSLARP